MQAIINRLFTLQDKKYQAFHSSLLPNINPDTVIGVRVPALRALAKELAHREEGLALLAELPHHYYEENILHGLLLEQEKEMADCLEKLDVFLPYVDNWAVCDIISPKCLKKDKALLLEKIRFWTGEEKPLYVRRFGLKLLMMHFLDDAFRPELLEIPASIRTEEYYLRMMQAWFFATALAKQWEAALPYLQEQRLEPWTHNKTIQKARESYRLTARQKEELKLLRIKV